MGCSKLLAIILKVEQGLLKKKKKKKKKKLASSVRQGHTGHVMFKVVS